MIKNWYSYNFVIDIFKTPELIPDLEETPNTKIDQFKLSSLLKKAGNSSNYHKLLDYLIFGPLYLVALFYRISLKSTLWFYMVLFFLVKNNNKVTENPRSIKSFLALLYTPKIETLQVFMATFSLVGVILTVFDYQELTNILNLPFSSVLVFLYFNFETIELWKAIQITIALLSLYLYFYSDKLHQIYLTTDSYKGFHFTFLQISDYIRRRLVVIYYFLALIFIAFELKIWEYSYISTSIHPYINDVVTYIIRLDLIEFIGKL